MVAQQIPLSFPVAESYAAADFVELPCNADAMAWIKRFPDWPYPVVIIYGEAGCGKTHLLSVWSEKTNGRYLAIDDVEQYFGNADAEQDLFHQFNMVRENGDYLLLSMDKNIAQQNIALPDLKSRLGAAPQIEISAPDDVDLIVILQKLFSDRQLNVGSDVISYMLPRVERRFSGLRDLVAQIDAASLSGKRPVTIPLVREILSDPDLFGLD